MSIYVQKISNVVIPIYMYYPWYLVPPNWISKQNSIFACLIIVKVSSIIDFDNEVQLQNILFEYENEELRKKNNEETHVYKERNEKCK